MRSAGSASPACPSPAGAARGSQLRHLSGGQCWITFLRSRAIASSSSWLLCSITSCGGGSSVEMRCRVCSVCSSISPLALARAAVTPTGIHRISVFGSSSPGFLHLNVSVGRSPSRFMFRLMRCAVATNEPATWRRVGPESSSPVWQPSASSSSERRAKYNRRHSEAQHLAPPARPRGGPA